MKVVVVAYGSRGDVEPCAALGRELMRRGHDVRVAAPPDRLALVEVAGLSGVAHGPDNRGRMDVFAKVVGRVANPWAAAVEGLGVGVGRPFAATTEDSLVADLAAILAPQCADRARVVATLTTPADQSAARAADLVEGLARQGIQA